MRIAYFDCPSGISGDMTLGALVDAGIDFGLLQDAIASLDIAGCRLEKEEVKRHGFRATKVHVRHEPEHAHRHLHHILEIIDRSAIREPQKDLARRIFQRLAESEAKVHGSTLEKVHFHEVGAVDSIADIIGAAVGIDELNVQRIDCSAVPTGQGQIKIAHGLVNVPAPATADLLRGIPIAHSDVEFELTTPTGAAILATVVDRFGSIPAMKIDRIGYGAGDGELKEQANVLRVLTGEAVQADPIESQEEDQVWIVETNLDDCTAETVSHCLECLWDLNVLDAFTTAIQMKKGRSAIKLTIICSASQVAAVEQVLFGETSTFGVRKWLAERRKLMRQDMEVETPWGSVQGQVVERPGAGKSFSPEFEACRELAKTNKIPLSLIYDAARRAFAP